VHTHEGEAVRRGEALLELVSLEYAGLVADVLRARAERNYQQSQVDRLLQLVEKKIAAQQSLEKAQADLLRARAEFDAAFARVSALGLTEDGLETAGPTLVLRAPIAGAIDRHEIDLGSAVTVYQEMLSIVDPSHVLVQAYVPPDEAGDVAPGDTVSIHGSDAGQAVLAARIATVNPALGAENRSVVANILTPTRGGWPRPGQAVQVTIAGLGALETLSVPLSAILYEGDRATVFVQLDDASYEQRPVVLGRLTADRAEVLEGLLAGEPVAVTQVFNLKALRRFDQFGEE
jgi:cobalt-zinc-cadmium efflux system membrane fusion protein